MAKQPKIRFKGFTEEWKEKTVEEVSIRLDNLRIPIAASLRVAGDTPYYGANGIQDYVEGYTHDGENILIAEDGASDTDVYPVRITRGKIWVNNHAHVLRGINGVMSNPFLLYALLKTDFSKILVGGTRHKLTTKALNSTIISFTPDEKEQKAITQTLSLFDTIISQREAELEKLKNIKRALLEKLFPQDGQSIPAIRFKGFEGKWSDVPFGKLIIENKEVSTVENEDTLLSSAIEGMFLNSELFDHQRGQSNIGYRKITKGMLILSAQNLHLGNANVNLRFDHGIVSPAYKTYNIQGADTEFMAVWVKREETKAFFDRATTAGASKCRKNIDWDDLYQQDLAMPLDKEQKKIGKFILTLDRLITLREKYIKQLKHSKQALLEQMFVNN